MTNQQPTDPREARIEHLEEEVRSLQLSFALQFGTDKVTGALLTTIQTIAEDVKELKEMKVALFGDGKGENVGLLVRLDRLEQAAKTSKWWSRAFATIGIAELAYIIFKH